MTEEHSFPRSSPLGPPSCVLQQKVAAEGSPTDRVERLLKKYKSRQVDKKTSTDRLSRQLISEEVSWKTLIMELDSQIPYHPGMRTVVVTAPPPTGAPGQGCLQLDVQSSATLRGAISKLLEQLRKRDTTHQATPTKTQHPITSTRVGRVTSAGELEVDPLVERLCSQVARLEYENAKLKVDLQNRPELHELRECQRKVKELERDLKQTRRLLSSEQVDCLQSQQQIENVCSLLSVSRSEDIVPKIRAMTQVIETQGNLEKPLSKVLEIVYNPAAPKWAWRGDSPSADLPRPVDHHLWCEVTWDHVILTLHEWLHHLRGLEDLNVVFTEVCQHFEHSHHRPASTVARSPGKTGKRRHHSALLKSRPTATGSPSLVTEDEGDGFVLSGRLRPSTGRARDGRTGELVRGKRSAQLSTHEMAGLLRHWLLDKGHLECVSVQSVLAMIRHFQQLFDVPRLDGVYAAMSRLYQQTEKAKNIFKQLKASLQLVPTCSNREMVWCVEYLTSQENSQLLLEIEREFGPLGVREVVEKLRLCNEFFPAFQTMVTELKDYLGVSTIGEITSAVYDL